MTKFETTAELATAIRQEIACMVAESAALEENLNSDGSINWNFVSADVHVDMPDTINHFVDSDQVPEALNVFYANVEAWFDEAADKYLEKNVH